MSTNSMIWLHGTEPDVEIERWTFPPPSAKHTPVLIPHSAVFLTTDKALALGAGGRLYAASMRQGANFIDLRQPSQASEALRRQVVKGKLGKDHLYTTAKFWTLAGNQGALMRFGSQKAHHVKDAEKIMRAKQAHDRGDRSSDTMRLMLKGQNITRAWIEELVFAGRALGLDALIVTEPDTYRPGGKVDCEVLIALNERALSPPEPIPGN